VQFSPFQDAQGQPIPQVVADAGAADLDGDGNVDLWFLAGPGPRQGEISVQMASTSNLGAFRPWHTVPPRAYTDGATLHRGSLLDQILIADPTVRFDPKTQQRGLMVVQFEPAPDGNGSDPRDGLWYHTLPNSWLTDDGIFEVETRDDSNDGFDDVVVLIDLGPQGTRVKKVVIEGTPTFPPPAVVSVDIPLKLERLQLLDLDGDDRTDFAAMSPGGGLLIYRDGGFGSFDLVLPVPSPVPVHDMFAGDILGEGRDALGLCTDHGVLIGSFTSQGITPYWLPNRPDLAPLANAEILADPEGPRVITVPRDGRGIGIHRFNPQTRTFAPPRYLESSPLDPPVSRSSEHFSVGRRAATGAIASGGGRRTTPASGGSRTPIPTRAFSQSRIMALTADVDGDGDSDLLVETASGTAWIALHNTVRNLALGKEMYHDIEVGNGSYYERREFSFVLPPDWTRQDFLQVEAAVYLKDPDTGITSYWGRLLPYVDEMNQTVSFTAYTLLNPGQRSTMIPLRLDGITISGEAVISVHGISGTKRSESIHLWHEPEGSGNGSGPGASWTMTAAPPLPTTSAAMLPWGGVGEGG
jgi:hypothetical protein